MTRVCESACTAYFAAVQVGEQRHENGIFAVWNVEISHSPLK
jgi:hypothetical protein